jgi:ribosomal protein L30E
MGIFEQTNSRINILNKIKQQKEAISKGLKIEWETDPDKMKFENLRSYGGWQREFNYEILRVEEYNLTSHPYTDIFIGDIKSHMEMIDILLKGGKLIPPSKTEVYSIVDGEEKMVIPSDTLGLFDGNHRCNLAKYFGLDTVPVVVFKVNEGYRFTPEKWTFEGPRIREEETTEFGMHWTEYNGLKAISKENGTVYTFKDHCSYIDDSNTEYLVIHTHG